MSLVCERHLSTKATVQCGRCDIGAWCNDDCRRAAWPTHKLICQPLSGPGVTGLQLTASRMVSGIRPVTDLQDRVWERAIVLKGLLAKRTVNIVTVESLTCGMMAKTLIDIPGSGDVVYGGFSTYDTDAKRVMVDVKTRGVYSHATAQQMAKGALKNSRAMISVSVTGNAMPYPDDNVLLGRVWIACAIRKRGGFVSRSIELDVEKTGEYKPLFDSWRAQNQGNGKWAPRALTALVADIIRLQTTATAFDFVERLISEDNFLDDLDSLDQRAWDSVVPPSWILQKYINPSLAPMPKQPVGTDDTDWTSSSSSSAYGTVDADIDDPEVQTLAKSAAREEMYNTVRTAVAGPLAALVPIADGPLRDATGALFEGFSGTLDELDATLQSMVRAIEMARSRINDHHQYFGLLDSVEDRSVPMWLVRAMTADQSMPRGFPGTVVMVDSPLTNTRKMAEFQSDRFVGSTSKWLSDTRITDREQFVEAWRSATAPDQDAVVQMSSPHLRGPYRFKNGPVYWYWSAQPSSRAQPAAK